MLAHLGLGCFDIGAVEHQERAALGRAAAQIRLIETAVQPLIGKGAVVGAIVDKLPAEGGLKEGLGGREIPRRKLHIVQFSWALVMRLSLLVIISVASVFACGS